MIVALGGSDKKKNPYGGNYGDSGYVSGKKIDGSWAIPKPPTYKKPTNGIYGGATAPAYIDPMQSYYDALERQKNERISQYRKMIDQQIGMAVGNLEAERSKIPGAYQPMKNQSELEKYKAAGRLRENQANRGALDSGAGRQESLALSNNYGNNLSQINLQEQSEIDEINRNIGNVRSQGEMQKAQAEYDMAGDMSSFLNQIDISQFQNQARGNAQNVVKRARSNQPTQSIGEASYNPDNSALTRSTGTPNNNDVFGRLIEAAKGSPVGPYSIYVNTLLKQGKISAEDAQKMLQGR